MDQNSCWKRLKTAPVGNKWRNIFLYHWKSSSAKLMYRTGTHVRLSRREKRKGGEINCKSARALPGTRYTRKKARKRSLRAKKEGKKSLFADRSRLGRDFNALVSYCGRGPSTPYQFKCSTVSSQLLFPVFTQRFLFSSSRLRVRQDFSAGSGTLLEEEIYAYDTFFYVVLNDR